MGLPQPGPCPEIVKNAEFQPYPFRPLVETGSTELAPGRTRIPSPTEFHLRFNLRETAAPQKRGPDCTQAPWASLARPARFELATYGFVAHRSMDGRVPELLQKSNHIKILENYRFSQALPVHTSKYLYFDNKVLP